MPILEKLKALEQAANNFGFRWDNTDQIMAQIKSECAEISVHLEAAEDNIKNAALEEEIGDLLHAVFSLCVFCEFDPQTTLEKSINKFERRFSSLKELACKKGLKNLDGKPFEELMALWNTVKQNEK